MKETTVSLAQAVIAEEAVLPVRVQEALGELVGAARVSGVSSTFLAIGRLRTSVIETSKPVPLSPHVIDGPAQIHNGGSIAAAR